MSKNWHRWSGLGAAGVSAPSLSYSATSFDEAGANDGSITETVTVTVSGGTWTSASGTMTEGTHYFLRGTAVPSGLTLVITRTSTTTATIGFTGNASSHNGTTVSGIIVQFLNDAFTGTVAPTDGSDDESFTINWDSNFDNGQSLNLDGTNEYVIVPDVAALDITNNLTVAGWVKINDITSATWFCLASKWGADGAKSWLVDFTNGSVTPASNAGAVWFQVSSDGNAAGSLKVTSDTELSSNTWTHVVCTFASGTAKIYINAVSSTLNTAGSAATIFSSSSDVWLGNDNGGVIGAGKIDEVSIWNVALSAAEVSELYNSGNLYDISTHSQYSNCVALWRFESDSHHSNSGGIKDAKSTNHGTGQNLESGDLQSDTPN